jgi:hypothetical protein
MPRRFLGRLIIGFPPMQIRITRPSVRLPIWREHSRSPGWNDAPSVW